MNYRRTVAFFLPALRLGGAEKSTVKLANAIAEHDINVDFIIASKIDPSLLGMLSPKIKIIKFNKSGVLTSLFNLASYLRYERPVSLLSVMDHANVIAIIANMLAGGHTKIVATIRSYLSCCFLSESSIKTKVVKFLATCLYSKAGAVIAVSKNVAIDAAKFFKLSDGKIKTIYNPILTDQLFALANTASNDVPRLVKDGKPLPLIVAVGRLEQEKNYPVLIKAMSIVLQTQKVQLLILGNGRLHNDLAKLINDSGLQEYVILLGAVTNPYVYMRNCDLFVLPSKYEGLPGALIEALALAPRIVATDCPGGTREILDNGRYGMLVKVDDEVALADAIIASLSTAKVNKVDESFLAKFKPEVVAQQYLDVMLSA